MSMYCCFRSCQIFHLVIQLLSLLDMLSEKNIWNAGCKNSAVWLHVLPCLLALWSGKLQFPEDMYLPPTLDFAYCILSLSWKVDLYFRPCWHSSLRRGMKFWIFTFCFFLPSFGVLFLGSRMASISVPLIMLPIVYSLIKSWKLHM